MKSIRRYSPSDQALWNEFVGMAKNGTFLFHRDYMDYHADRFADHSLLIFENEKLEAVFVANEKAKSIFSHEGLTYGGLVLRDNARLEDVLSYFFHLTRYYHFLGFTEIIYKCFPSFLATYPAQEDQYALFLLKANLIRRDSNCVFVRSQALPYQHNRKRAIAKAQKQNYVIKKANDPASFWEKVLVPNLQERFGVTPVHTAAEMKLLMSRFPDNIHVYEVTGDELLAGSVIYETPGAIHAQYIASTLQGKEAGALDLLFDELIFRKYSEKSFVSLGISNEKSGTVLNRGLMNWKEGFGARTIALDFYRVDTSQHTALADYE